MSLALEQARQAQEAGEVPVGAVLVLAGILQTQFAKVERAYRQAGLRLLATEVEKEWQSGAFVRTRK